MITLKVLSSLLTYPTAGLQAAAEELKAALWAEDLLPRAQEAEIYGLIDDIAASDLYEAQERYVTLFDRTRSLSLHLFEHVHGEGRDRGQAMVDLLRIYEEGGYSPTASELPDFLPLFLEYASTRPAAEALELVGQPAHVLAALQERLAKRGSLYAVVFAALIHLGKVVPDEATLAALRAEPDPAPDDLEALDAAWEDEEVRFGPDANGCGDVLTAKLRQARRPAPGLEPHPDTRRRTLVANLPA
ncbi:MAG: nitrate reductase molybdenum cofactor assembly chaperone [Geminicoccaceae bacterium]